MTSLILIEGPANSGKTTIAWKVYLEMKKYASAVRYWNANGAEEFPVNEIAEDDNGNSVDFRAILTIRDRVFAISSMGDIAPMVEGDICGKYEGGIEWGWQMRVDAIIQCVRNTIKTAMAYINRECANMPQIRFTTDQTTSPLDPNVDANQKDKVDAIVKCVLEP